MIFTERDRQMMRRALTLAAFGRGHVSPNPMVGAVITAPDGRIIGEGWHRRYGGPHAEVNAVRSVREADTQLFPESTIYVTLEPCSHYGKTPPCAKLLTECGFKRVVIASDDPNPKVSGRGIAMLRDAGIAVETGLYKAEADELNRAFMTAHRQRRPFVTLKWAQSADGYLDRKRSAGEPAARFSTPLSSQVVHLRRSCHDGIAVGARTMLEDSPRLDVRYLAGNSPRPILFDRSRIVGPDLAPIASMQARGLLVVDSREALGDTLRRMYAEEGLTSLLVEGGASLLNSFIASGLWDAAFVEVAPIELGETGAVKAPTLDVMPQGESKIGENRVFEYRHTPSKKLS